MSNPPIPGPSTPQSGFNAALQYTGIPASWIRRPKLPSRNWIIFISVTSTVLGLYAYDRRKCKQIRDTYIERVKHLAEEPLHSLDYPRKVTVYGSKWPGDDDHNRCVQYFRKYLKPVLVAAAVDYEIVNGKRHGDLAVILAEQIKARRRRELGLEPASPVTVIPLPGRNKPEEKLERELQGGSIIIGRHTLKEYIEGLKRGWTDSPEKVDREDVLSRELDSDRHFDEPELDDLSTDLDGEPIPTPSRLLPSKSVPVFSPLKLNTTPSTPKHSVAEEAFPISADTPPTSIPPIPPLLLVPFTNYIGFKQIPLMIWDFFNQRRKVQAGSQAAYALVMGQTRPFQPSDAHEALKLPSETQALPSTDVDFDRDAEWYYKNSLNKLEAEIDSARAEYYKTLPKKLETARALARGTREPTKEEQSYPPPTEVALRDERMKKELRWRGDVTGWNIVKPETDVPWDERFRGSLKVFVPPPEEKTDT